MPPSMPPPTPNTATRLVHSSSQQSITPQRLPAPSASSGAPNSSSSAANHHHLNHPVSASPSTPRSGPVAPPPQRHPPQLPGQVSGQQQQQQQQHQQSPQSPGAPAFCSGCGKQIDGQFVRALSGQFHLECFRCRDCHQIVAEKFFPATDSRTGEKVILCERDYFRRLDLLCAKCGQALRGAHINALNKKYHLEHFTCSVCATVFRQHDSYYEREGQVYCQHHYAVLFAARCGGCHTAVLKNFVEMTTKESKIEQWHPECYMIFKLWNVRIAKIVNPNATSQQLSQAHAAQRNAITSGTADQPEADGVVEQQRVTEEVAQILHVLSAYEESSAECISDMLLWFSGNEFEEGVLQASRLIYHIEALFKGVNAVKDKLTTHGESILIHNYNEPKQLAKRVVHFFSLLSYARNTDPKHAGEKDGQAISGSQTISGSDAGGLASSSNAAAASTPSTHPIKQQAATKEMISLVTSLAHTLKILIRAALVGALKLERVYNDKNAVQDLLAELEACHGKSLIDVQSLEEYGPDVKTDLCCQCHRSIEEECFRFENMRWHSSCFACGVCGRELKDEYKHACYDALGNRVLCQVHYEHMSKLPAYRSQGKGGASGVDGAKLLVNVIKPVSQLDQYVFLLRCALKRLCILLNVKMEMYPVMHQQLKDGAAQSPGSKASPSNRPPSPSSTPGSGSATDSYFNLETSTSTLSQLGPNNAATNDPKSNLPASNANLASSSSASTAVSNGYVQEQQRNLAGKIPLGSLAASGHPHKLTKPAVTSSTSTLAIGTSQSSLAGGVSIYPPGHAVPMSPDGSKPSFSSSSTPLSSTTRLSPQKQKSGPQVSGGKQAIRSTAQKATGVGAGSENSRFLSELSVLDHWAVRQHAAQFLHPLLNKNEFTMEQLMDFATLRKPSMWSKMVDVLKPGKNKQLPETLFGVPLELLVDKFGVDSDLGVGFSGVQIPAFVDSCIRIMLRQDLSVEGIFRKNGNIKKMKTTATMLDEDPSNMEILEGENAIQLAALLKKFLRDLPEPLLTFKLYRLFIASQRITDEQHKMQILHYACALLPKPNLDLLATLVWFCHHIAKSSHMDSPPGVGNKMDIANLAMVMAPNILYSKSSKTVSDDDALLAITAVHMIFDNYAQLWQIPADIYERIRGDIEYADTTSLNVASTY